MKSPEELEGTISTRHTGWDSINWNRPCSHILSKIEKLLKYDDNMEAMDSSGEYPWRHAIRKEDKLLIVPFLKHGLSPYHVSDEFYDMYSFDMLKAQNLISQIYLELHDCVDTMFKHIRNPKAHTPSVVKEDKKLLPASIHALRVLKQEYEDHIEECTDDYCKNTEFSDYQEEYDSKVYGSTDDVLYVSQRPAFDEMTNMARTIKSIHFNTEQMWQEYQKEQQLAKKVAHKKTLIKTAGQHTKA